VAGLCATLRAILLLCSSIGQLRGRRRATLSNIGRSIFAVQRDTSHGAGSLLGPFQFFGSEDEGRRAHAYRVGDSQDQVEVRVELALLKLSQLTRPKASLGRDIARAESLADTRVSRMASPRATSCACRLDSLGMAPLFQVP
jgi:hypothetical protein